MESDPDVALANGSAAPQNQPSEEWADLKPLLDQATNELQEGKLILAPFFDLFDSMSALEIMDPKMDSGLLLCNKPDFPPLDCLETRTPEEVLWIIDQFTACEMTWQSGYSAAQTILMCPYLKFLIPLTPGEIMAYVDSNAWNYVLYSHLVAAMTCVSVVWHEMRSGNLYEDEDFINGNYGQTLTPKASIPECLRLLTRARLIVTESLISPDDQGPDRSTLLALKNRLEVRMRLLQLLQLYPFTTDVEYEIETLNDQYFSCRDSDFNTENTYELGSVVHTFDHRESLKLIGQSPPRKITLLTATEAALAMDRIVRDLSRITALRSPPSSEAIKSFLDYFQRGPDLPLPLARSALMSMLDRDGTLFGHRTHFQIVADSVREFCCPPTQFFPARVEFDGIGMPGDNPNASRPETLATQFLKFATPTFLLSLKLRSQNLCRQRRLQRKLLANWNNLHSQILILERQNSEINRSMVRVSVQGTPFEYGYFSAWAMDNRLSIMIDFILSGITLDIYSPSELIIIYWWADYLLSVRIGHLQSVAQDIGKIVKSTKLSGINPLMFAKTTRLLESKCQRLVIMQEFCRGVFLLLATLVQIGQHPKWNFGLSDIDSYFCARFRVFLGIRNPTLLRPNEWISVAQYLTTANPRQLLDKARSHMANCQINTNNFNAHPSADQCYALCVGDSLDDYFTRLGKAVQANQVIINDLRDQLTRTERVELKTDPACPEFIYFEWKGQAKPEITDA